MISLMTAACACCTWAAESAAGGWSLLLRMWICRAAWLLVGGVAACTKGDFLLGLPAWPREASLSSESSSSSSESVEKRLAGKQRMVPTLVLPGEDDDEPSNWGIRSEELPERMKEVHKEGF